MHDAERRGTLWAPENGRTAYRCSQCATTLCVVWERRIRPRSIQDRSIQDCLNGESFGRFFSGVRDLAQRIPEELATSWPMENRASIRAGMEDRIEVYLCAFFSYRGRIEEIGGEE